MTTAVAMAVYNGVTYIEGQLDSIRLQTKQPDHVVICDDGSKDNTVSFVREYIRRHGLQERWEIIENEKNLGYIKNFYHAMELSKADLIFLSDQDDVWSLDKIEKMERVFVQHTDVKLLSCSHGFIDQGGQQIKSLLTPKPVINETIVKVDIHAIMISFLWPGMSMAIRSNFFREILPQINDVCVPHDVSLAVMAAKEEGFYEYHYLGVNHRRHGNNTGGEEHRLSKVLNFKRKLKEIQDYNTMLQRILGAELGLNSEQSHLIKLRLQYSVAREAALVNRSIVGLLKLYSNDGENYLRKFSMLCDLFLVVFGKN